MLFLHDNVHVFITLIELYHAIKIKQIDKCCLFILFITLIDYQIC
jgi:hypothetical protein